MGMVDSRQKLLLLKLSELTGDRDAIEILGNLPSRSARYTHYQCAAIPLLRKCIDR